MPILLDPNRAILGLCLLAAGCSGQKEEFADTKSQLICEIRNACGESRDCDDVDAVSFSDRCERYHPVKANECIDKLEAHLAMVEEDSATCDQSFSYFECDQAIQRRATRGCKISIQ